MFLIQHRPPVRSPRSEVYKQKEILKSERNRIADKFPELITTESPDPPVTTQQIPDVMPNVVDATPSSQEPTDQSATPSDEPIESKKQEQVEKTARKRKHRKRKSKTSVGKPSQSATQLQISEDEAPKRKRRKRRRRRNKSQKDISLFRGEMRRQDQARLRAPLVLNVVGSLLQKFQSHPTSSLKLYRLPVQFPSHKTTLTVALVKIMRSRQRRLLVYYQRGSQHNCPL